MRPNEEQAAPLRRWRFGRVEFDEHELALKLDGKTVEIERKPLLVLRHLLLNAGEVVTKDALVRAVWPGRIVTDWALAKSVGRLRDALEDRAQALVRTHHGFGYRFVAELEVETFERGAAETTAAPAAPPLPASEPLALPETAERRDAERRPLTLLFCDLVDSTRLADTLDAEAFRDLLIAYRGTANAIGARYEAHLAQQSGDGLLMYFGYPAAHDDDAERAVRCACELLAALKRQRSATAPLSLRIGIHSGAVLIGEFERGGELLATGASLHLAARLQALAEPDTILMSDATFRLVPGLFVTRDFGEQEIRGLSEPVRVHQAIHPSGVRSRLAAAARLTPFVGREVEIGLLEACWQHAVNGEGRAVLFRAEPGLGKSRLLMEVRARLAGRPYSWHECRADALNRHSAYHPVIELIRSGLALKEGDDEMLRLARLEQGFADIALDCAEAVPLIGPLLGIAPTAQYPPSPLAPMQQRRRTLELLAECIERLSHQQPLVVAFEDLHWCDESSLEFLGVLLERLPRLPLLLVMTTRLEFSAPWPASGTLNLRSLDPLPLWEVERMLDSLAGGAALAPNLSLLIFERAGGVPLFVEELTRSLIESGQIVEHAGQLAARVPLGDLAIPVSLHGLLLARLDRLGAARELIQIAAVIGREVPYRLLQLVTGLEEPVLRERLSPLCESGLLHARDTPPEASYVFKHALIQDAAYDTLLKTRRQALHGRIADALAAQFPDTAKHEPALLALHFEHAGKLETAARWYKQAAETTVAVISMNEALTHAEHGAESSGSRAAAVRRRPPHVDAWFRPCRGRRSLERHAE
ncbi:MAG: AAA family ATPase [Panacagrimonas sp.]